MTDGFIRLKLHSTMSQRNTTSSAYKRTVSHRVSQDITTPDWDVISSKEDVWCGKFWCVFHQPRRREGPVRSTTRQWMPDRLIDRLCWRTSCMFLQSFLTSPWRQEANTLTKRSFTVSIRCWRIRFVLGRGGSWWITGLFRVPLRCWILRWFRRERYHCLHLWQDCGQCSGRFRGVFIEFSIPLLGLRRCTDGIWDLPDELLWYLGDLHHDVSQSSQSKEDDLSTNQLFGQLSR